MVQWLGLCAFTAVGPGAIPGWGTKIRQAVQLCRNKQTNKQKNKIAIHHLHLGDIQSEHQGGQDFKNSLQAPR